MHGGVPVKEQLLAALERSGWSKSKAAQLLGIGRFIVHRAMKFHGIANKRRDED